MHLTTYSRKNPPQVGDVVTSDSARRNRYNPKRPGAVLEVNGHTVTVGWNKHYNERHPLRAYYRLLDGRWADGLELLEPVKAWREDPVARLMVSRSADGIVFTDGDNQLTIPDKFIRAFFHKSTVRDALLLLADSHCDENNGDPTWSCAPCYPGMYNVSWVAPMALAVSAPEVLLEAAYYADKHDVAALFDKDRNAVLYTLEEIRDVFNLTPGVSLTIEPMTGHANPMTNGDRVKFWTLFTEGVCLARIHDSNRQYTWQQVAAAALTPKVHIAELKEILAQAKNPVLRVAYTETASMVFHDKTRRRLVVPAHVITNRVNATVIPTGSGCMTLQAQPGAPKITIVPRRDSDCQIVGIAWHHADSFEVRVADVLLDTAPPHVKKLFGDDNNITVIYTLEDMQGVLWLLGGFNPTLGNPPKPPVPVTDEDRVDMWLRHRDRGASHRQLCDEHPKYTSAQVSGALRTNEDRIWELRVKHIVDDVMDNFSRPDALYQEALGHMRDAVAAVGEPHEDYTPCELTMQDVADFMPDPNGEETSWLLDAVFEKMNDRLSLFSVSYDSAGGMSSSKWGCFIIAHWDFEQACKDL